MILTAIDMHVHLWQHNAASDAKVLCAMLDRFAIEWLGIMPLWGGYYPTREEIRDGNIATRDFCRDDPKRRKAFVTINARHDKFARDEIARGLDAGAIAVKIWVSTRADEAATFPVAQMCIEQNVPLLLHAFHKTVGQLPHETDAQHVAALARRFPELKIVMAHLAGAHGWGCAHIADCPNVWSDFSGSYCESGTIETAVKLLGEDRVLFGSDAPGADYINNLAKLESADLSELQQRKILRDNAAALFGRAV